MLSNYSLSQGRRLTFGRSKGRHSRERMLSIVLTDLLRATPGDTDESDDFRISLAGAQEKTALLRLNEKWMRPKGTTPTTHILKLPIGTGAAASI